MGKSATGRVKMNPEEIKELRELIEFLKDNKIGEFDLERGDLKVRIKFAPEGGPQADLATRARFLAAQMTAASAPAVSPQVHAAAHAAAPAPAAPPPAADEDASLHIVKSHIVGTFYE